MDGPVRLVESANEVSHISNWVRDGEGAANEGIPCDRGIRRAQSGTGRKRTPLQMKPKRSLRMERVRRKGSVASPYSHSPQPSSRRMGLGVRKGCGSQEGTGQGEGTWAGAGARASVGRGAGRLPSAAAAGSPHSPHSPGPPGWTRTRTGCRGLGGEGEAKAVPENGGLTF